MQSHYQSISRGLIRGDDVAYFLFIDFLFLWLARLAIVWKRSIRKVELTRWLLGTAIATVVYFIALSIPVQFDFTSDKRFTMTSASVDLLQNVDDEIFVTCYLSGDYPANWKRLERAVRYQLQDFADASNGNEVSVCGCLRNR